MDARLLCWAVFCLLGEGHAGAGVSQSPRHRVTKRGQDVALSCDPISGHISLYWYRQTAGKGPEFLVYFQNEDPVDKSGMTNNRLSASRSEGTNSTLQIQRAEQGDSAVYLCASSPTTVGPSHLRALHKPLVRNFSSFSGSLNKGVALFFLIRGNKHIWDFSCSSDSKRSGNDLQIPEHLLGYNNFGYVLLGFLYKFKIL